MCPKHREWLDLLGQQSPASTRIQSTGYSPLWYALVWNTENWSGVQGSDVTSWKSKTIYRRAIKLIPNLISLPYKDGLEALRLPCLYYRKRRGDMFQVYRILKGTDRLESSQFFSLADMSNTRGWQTIGTGYQRTSRARSRQSYIKYIQISIRQKFNLGALQSAVNLL